MAELTRGTISDRPWGWTLGALGLRGLSGELAVSSDGKVYRVAFSGGVVVAAFSPLASDSSVRVALTSNLITSTQVADITRRIGAAPDRDEVELIAELARLTPDHAQRLRRRIVAHRAARTFAIDRGEFVVDDSITLDIADNCELDIRTVIYLGARTHLSEDRLASELAQMGGHFRLKQEAIADLPQYGFGDLEKPMLKLLVDGANLGDLEVGMQDLGARGVRAICYALASCNACDMSDARPSVRPGARAMDSADRARTQSRPIVQDPPIPSRTQTPSIPAGTRPPSRSITQDPPMPSRTQTPIMPSGTRPPSRPITQDPPTERPAQRPITQDPPTNRTGPRPITQDPPTNRPVPKPLTQDPPTRRTGQREIIQDPPMPSRTHTPSSIPPRSRTTSPSMPVQSDPTIPAESRTTSPTIPAQSRTTSPTMPAQGTEEPAHGTGPQTPVRGSTGPQPAQPRTSTGSGVPRPGQSGSFPAAGSGAIPRTLTPRSASSGSNPPPTRRPRNTTAASQEIEQLLTQKLPMLDDGVDHFTLLGVSTEATGDTIRNAYFLLARKLHPDRLAAVGVEDQERRAQRVMAQVNAAFAILNDPIKRSDYIVLQEKGGEQARRAEEQSVDDLATRVLKAEEAFKSGEMALRREQLDVAVQQFTMAVELQPREAEYQAMLAWAQFAQATDKNSVATATKRALLRAAETNEHSPTARFYLGRVERMLGREKEALGHFQEVLKIKANHAEAASEIRILEQRLKSKR